MESKKNPEANLELMVGPLIIAGVVFALAVVLVAFEWKDIEDGGGEVAQVQLDILEEEIIEVTIPQEVKPPPPPQQVNVIEIVEDEEDVEEELEIEDMDVEEETVVEVIEEEEEEVVEEQIFTIVEKMPTFPGGEKELFKYLGKSIKYPAMAKDAGISGVVYVTFVIDKSGAVKDAKVLRGIGGGCDEEALRVVKKMPKWSPGKQRGKAVKVQYNLPIRFTLK